MAILRKTGMTSLLAVALVVGLGVGSAVAKRGQTVGKGGRGDSSLSLVVVEPAGGEAVWGGTVTFDVSTTATEQPHVRLDCSQDGEPVYWSSAGFYDEYPWQWARNFKLASDFWTGGAASCIAEMYHTPDGRRFRTLASITFEVAA